MIPRLFPPLVDIEAREIRITPAWLAAAAIGGLLIVETIALLLAVGP